MTSAQKIIRTLWIALIAICIAIGVFLAYGYLQFRKDAERSIRRGEAEQIATSMNYYIHETGKFPPRFAAHNETGEQVFWPILLEIHNRTDLGKNYNQSQPWNSTSNLAALLLPSRVFCNSTTLYDSKIVPAATFIAINDEDSILINDIATAQHNITDGLDNTLLVAEVPRPKSPWSEPISISFDEFEQHCDNLRNSIEESSVGFTGQVLLFADLKTYCVVRPLPKDVFRALWTKSGGEPVSRAQLIQDGLLR